MLDFQADSIVTEMSRIACDGEILSGRGLCLMGCRKSEPEPPEQDMKDSQAEKIVEPINSAKLEGDADWQPWMTQCQGQGGGGQEGFQSGSYTLVGTRVGCGGTLGSVDPGGHCGSFRKSEISSCLSIPVAAFPLFLMWVGSV